MEYLTRRKRCLRRTDVKRILQVKRASFLFVQNYGSREIGNLVLRELSDLHLHSFRQHAQFGVCQCDELLHLTHTHIYRNVGIERGRIKIENPAKYKLMVNMCVTYSIFRVSEEYLEGGVVQKLSTVQTSSRRLRVRWTP